VTNAAMSRSLKEVSKLYLDSNIFIYLLEGEPELQELVQSAFSAFDENKVTLYTSEITITECLNGAFRARLEDLAQKYLDLFGSEDFVTVLPVDSDVCIEAARLGAAHRLKTVDAIHLASATLAGCQALLSNDGGFRSTEGVEAIQLTEFESM
jgi:predicted nucleic acid-binding protein